MAYSVHRGKIISDDGVPFLPRWFCDDLVSFEADSGGISKVSYFNMTTHGSEKVLVDDMWGGIRFYICDGVHRYGQNIKECTVMPYGFCGVWEYGGFSFAYEQRVFNNSIFISLKTPLSISENLKFSAELYEAWFFTPFKRGDCRFVSGVDRLWNKSEFDNNIFKKSFKEQTGECGIAITSNASLDLTVRKKGIHNKYILCTDILKPGNKYFFVISFDNSENKSCARAADTVQNCDGYICVQNRRYENVMNRIPKLKSNYRCLDDFFVLAPLYHEACKVISVPGGIRAKTETYWIWGWDGMTSSFAFAYWGDNDFMDKSLKMYMETADPVHGIAHSYARDMSQKETGLVAEQGFYINFLYQYYLNGGNIKPYYDFAKMLFDIILQSEVKNTGLCKGYSLVPDFRETILENGNDISAFNNSTAYCAVRAMQGMAKYIGDTDTYLRAKSFADKAKKSFSDILYDEDKGFFSSSADSETLCKRPVYMSPSIKWDNLFCYDLIKGKEKQLLKFFEDNFLCESGICYVPFGGIGYDEDANQLHCYWPAKCEAYSRLINFENRRDLIDKMIGWIECWTKILQCPECIDCYVNENKPKLDFWNSINGSWQAFSMRGWYESVVHAVFGVDFDEDGMNIYPYDGDEMSLNGLNFAGKRFDIRMSGSGSNINSVILNGRNIGSVRKIFFSDFSEKNIMEIIRCN